MVTPGSKTFGKKDKERLVRFVNQLNLPSKVEYFVKKYSKYGERNPFIWRWCRLVASRITFSSITVSQERVYGLKVLMIMVVVLLDDIADEIKDRDFLMEVISAIRDPLTTHYKSNESNLSNKKRGYLGFIIEILAYIKSQLQQFPRYKQYKELFRFDFEQMLSSMNYALLISDNAYLMNSVEYFEYFSSNMQSKISGTIDLMASKSFKDSELGNFRRIVYHAQIMARIGNWLSTWKREIKSGDFTSVVFPIAVEQERIGVKDLLKDPSVFLSRVNILRIKKNLLKEWGNHYDAIEKYSKKMSSIDVGRFLEGMTELLQLHLGSEGLK